MKPVSRFAGTQHFGDMVYLLSALLAVPILLLAHAYLVFPVWMIYIRKKAPSTPTKVPDVEVAVLMAVYNEESVLRQKLDSMLASREPLAGVRFFVASDASTDGTDAILSEYAGQYPEVHYQRFAVRSGKAAIINHLAQESSADILVMTDADTFFHPETLPNLLRPFHDVEVGGVQANLITRGEPHEQVALQEVTYNKRELKIKQGEGVRGAVIGAGGYCYAIRKSLYTPVPEGFYVDDFFIFMRVLQQGYKTCFAQDAYCTMQVSGSSEVQFKRKVRISKGNFQNLAYFRDLANPLRNFVGLAFFSHKVLRWIGPFLLILAATANGLLLSYHPVFTWLLTGQGVFYGLGLLDLLLRRWQCNLIPLRFISHFLLMNLALLVGFFQYFGKSGDGTWDNEP